MASECGNGEPQPTEQTESRTAEEGKRPSISEDKPDVAACESGEEVNEEPEEPPLDPIRLRPYSDESSIRMIPLEEKEVRSADLGEESEEERGAATIQEVIESNFLTDPVPWYEKDQVLYGFYDNEVTRKLKQLMGSEVVRILDRDYMSLLQDRLYDSHWEALKKRVIARMEREGEKRKQLYLRGKLEGAPIPGHPAYEALRLAEEDANKQIQKNKIRPEKKHKRLRLEYNQFMTESDVESNPSEVSLIPENIPDIDEVRAQARRCRDVIDEETALGVLPTEEMYHRLVYEAPLVTAMRQAETVEDLYKLADEILFTGSEKTSSEVEKTEKEANA